MNSPCFISIDLFAGCGGLTCGMNSAGFKTLIAIELEAIAARAYRLNYPDAIILNRDIRHVSGAEVKSILGSRRLHLLAGCPPCQGFSTIRRLNKSHYAVDKRNNLVSEYFRLIYELRPLVIMMENVPGLLHYELFKNIVKKLDELGYNTNIEIVNVKDYGVPQNRKRLVLVGSILGPIHVAKPANANVTVRDAIFNLPLPSDSLDPVHRIVSQHSQRVMERIKLIPKDGGSRKDLPEEFVLPCHKNKNSGFNDIYGRLRWDTYSGTITGGCLNPSKGRFLHPEQDRALTPREAALLQSFPEDYKFPIDISKDSLALLIGNALPPKFSYYQSKNIYNHLVEYGMNPCEAIV